MSHLKSPILIFLLLLFFSKVNLAQQGCAKTNPASSNPTIHTSRIGVVTPPRYSPIGTITLNVVGQPQPQCNNFYRSIVSFAALGSCRINRTSTTSTTTTSYDNGWLVTYTLNCPLDDYIPHLLLASGSFGFVILRRRNLLNITQIFSLKRQQFLFDLKTKRKYYRI